MMRTNKVKKRKIESHVTHGRGNVFADLGFIPAESDELQTKAELTRQIYNRIKALGLTQIQASERLGISQPDVSKLMNARFIGYSTDRLISLLNALGVDVDIIVRPKKDSRLHPAGIVRVRKVRSVA